MLKKSSSSRGLLKTVIVRALLAFIFMLAIFFLPAGTFDYWQAWLYLAVLFIPMSLMLAYFLKNDPVFLERRMRYKEKEQEQKWIIAFSYLPFGLAFVLPALDKRFGWSSVPDGLVIAADLLVFLGYFITILVFRETRYASRIVEVEEEQSVISSGPYSIVRHPMYSGVALMYIFTPLALGSYWSIIPALFIIPVLAARLLNEEKVLKHGLKGYAEYMLKTRYRLLPGIW